jgi:hypothetical protein
MDTKAISIMKHDRGIFTGLFIAGFALCARGIAKAPIYGWTHPISLMGIVLGGAALLLGVQVIFRARVLPLRSDRQAIYALLGIAALKILLAELYR